MINKIIIVGISLTSPVARYNKYLNNMTLLLLYNGTAKLISNLILMIPEHIPGWFRTVRNFAGYVQGRTSIHVQFSSRWDYCLGL